MLVPVARRARLALSAPVVLRGATRRGGSRAVALAALLALPQDGAKRLSISGPAAAAYFKALGERVGNPPVDARFEVSGEGIQVLPSTSRDRARRRADGAGAPACGDVARRTASHGSSS